MYGYGYRGDDVASTRRGRVRPSRMLLHAVDSDDGGYGLLVIYWMSGGPSQSEWIVPGTIR